MSPLPLPNRISRFWHRIGCLVLAGTLAWSANAALNHALSFDGVDDYVETSTNVIPASGDFTVSCWAYATHPYSLNMEILSQGSYGNAFYIGTRWGTLRLGDGWPDTGLGFPDPGWHHFAVVKTSADTFFYLDGTNLLCLGSAIPNPAATPLRLGRQYGQLGEYCTGWIGDVRVWKRALSAAEVEASLTQPVEVTDPGLVAAWRFDEMVGNTCTSMGVPAVVGTLVHGPAWRVLPTNFTRLRWPMACYRQVGPGYALGFDGVQNWVDTGVAPIPDTGDFTVECWAFATRVPGTGTIEILSQGGPGNAFYIGAYNGKIRLGDGWLETGLDFPVGQWHHFAVVKTSDETRFYLDGTNVLSRGSAIPNPAPTTPLRLGRQYGGYGEFFPGLIDEVRVWSRALGGDEIQTSMHYAPVAGSAGLEAYWPFSEGRGLGVGQVRSADASGRGHTLDLGPWPSWAPGAGWAPTLEWHGGDPLFQECHQDFANPVVGRVGLVALAAGTGHSLGLKADNTVVAWGWNHSGSVPADLGGVVAIAAGSYHSLALKADGKVAAWGLGGKKPGEGNVPPGLAHVVAIAAGSYHSLALKSDATVTAWGDNSWGQCNVPTDLGGVVAIAAGSHSLALKSDGTVTAWGQCNVPPGLTDAVAISAGFFYNLTLKADGTVIGWGENDYNQCAVPDGPTRVPLQVQGTVDANVQGLYPLVFSASNHLGEVPFGTRTVVVRDTTGPVVTPKGPNPAVVAVDTSWVDPGATASDACSGDVPGSLGGSGALNLQVPGVYTLHYAATDPSGNVGFAHRTVQVVTAPSVGDLSGAYGSSETDSGTCDAALRATVNPNGLPTSVRFEYGLPPGYSSALRLDLPATFAPTNLVVSAGGLAPGNQYHWRVVATNLAGVTASPDQVVTIPPVPSLSGISGACVMSDAFTGASVAKLRATANPNGPPATVVFQYGRTTNYGAASRLELPTSSASSHLVVDLAGLVPNYQYHWRVFASNAFGVVTSPDNLLVAVILNEDGGGETFLAGDFDGNGVVDKSEVESVLFGYLSSHPALTLTNLAGLGQSRVAFTLPEMPAATLSVEVSTNLTTWETLGDAVPRYEFMDTNAPASPQRFYRLRWP